MTAFRFIASFALLLLTFILIARSYTARSVSLPPEAYCGYPVQAASPLAAETIQLQLWAVAYGQYCGRAFGPVVAARQLVEPKIAVVAKPLSMLSDAFRLQFAQAAQAGRAPDITVANIGDLVDWSNAGYLVPLDRCRTQHTGFTNVIEQLWTTQLWQNQVWGIPVNVRLEILYFNKAKLKALGWSDRQIKELPDQIKTGNFTLDDLVMTAQQAIVAGVVEPGFGYWPHLYRDHMLQLIYLAYGGRLYDADQEKRVITQKALVKTYALRHRLTMEQITLPNFAESAGDTWQNGNLWHDAVMQGRVLFWTANTSDWREWTVNYVNDLGGLAYQLRTVGYALFPSAQPGVAGHALWNSATYYVVVAEKASGRTYQDAACAVLAQTATPAINVNLGMTTGEQTILQSEVQKPTYTTDPFNKGVAYMWNYAVADSRRKATLLAATPYTPLLVEFMEKVERGELPPDVAAANAVQRLRETLGDALVVE
ncbi:MAG: carbohydrate ABC transporter substrate-binding protein [Caldilinea sp. CFX5]|nr:carbohydrate ABC transporter substrate-binding protein [Caldilinea sp. CFX5]